MDSPTRDAAIALLPPDFPVGLAASLLFLTGFVLFCWLLIRLTASPAETVIIGDRRSLGLARASRKAMRFTRGLLFIGSAIGLYLVRDGLGGLSAFSDAPLDSSMIEGAMILAWALATGLLLRAAGRILIRTRPAPIRARAVYVLAQVHIFFLSLGSLFWIFHLG